MDQLLGLRPEWEAAASEIHADGLYYVSIADLGREVFRAQLDTAGAAWVDAFYSIVEQGLAMGDSQAQNLVVVGLFESLQGQSHQQGPHDLVEQKLGPRSLIAWQDLIEGWTGGGVRTIEKWRRVIRNGAISRVEWQRHGLRWEAVWQDDGVRWTSEHGERQLLREEQSALEQSLRPFIARGLAEEPAAPPQWTDQLRIEGPHQNRELRFAGPLAFDGEKWFIAAITDIAWPQ